MANYYDAIGTMKQTAQEDSARALREADLGQDVVDPTLPEKGPFEPVKGSGLAEPADAKVDDESWRQVKFKPAADKIKVEPAAAPKAGQSNLDYYTALKQVSDLGLTPDVPKREGERWTAMEGAAQKLKAAHDAGDLELDGTQLAAVDRLLKFVQHYEKSSLQPVARRVGAGWVPPDPDYAREAFGYKEAGHKET